MSQPVKNDRSFVSLLGPLGKSERGTDSPKTAQFLDLSSSNSKDSYKTEVAEQAAIRMPSRNFQSSIFRAPQATAKKETV